MINMNKICKECETRFTYGPDNPNDLRGLRTRKICDGCRITKKRVESREYQRKKRLNMNKTQVG